MISQLSVFISFIWGECDFISSLKHRVDISVFFFFHLQSSSKVMNPFLISLLLAVGIDDHCCLLHMDFVC
jgi:hypothetical protein